MRVRLDKSEEHLTETKFAGTEEDQALVSLVQIVSSFEVSKTSAPFLRNGVSTENS